MKCLLTLLGILKENWANEGKDLFKEIKLKIFCNWLQTQISVFKKQNWILGR